MLYDLETVALKKNKYEDRDKDVEVLLGSGIDELISTPRAEELLEDKHYRAVEVVWTRVEEEQLVYW